MKVTPVAQGSGVPAGQQDASLGRTADASKLARAKAIASGQEVVVEAPPVTSGDAQVDKINTRKIKMKTQVSTNRNDQGQFVKDEPVKEEIPIPDATEPVKEPEERRPIDPQVAAFLKAKRALQVKEREIADREKALEGKAPVNPEEYISKADLMANPLKVFESGVSYDQLTEAILANQNAPVDTAKLRSEIKEEIKQELLGEFGSRDEQAEKQVLAEIKRESDRLIATSEEFETLREAKARNHPDFSNGKDPVRDLIHRTWKSTGEIMDISEAAKLVEDQLLDELTPFAKLKKVQSRLNPTPPPAQPAPERPNVKVMRTLTNRDNATPIMDKRARAVAAFYGTLKKG